MLFPTVWFRFASGRSAALGNGDIIGRLESAALVIDEPTVSQAHAMVSLREGSFYLLSLRRLFAVNGTPTSEICLSKGMRIALADGVVLTVQDIKIPNELQTIESAGFGTRVLHPISSLFAESPPRLVARYEPDADAHLLAASGSWSLQISGQPAAHVKAGDRFKLCGQEFELGTILLESEPMQMTPASGVLMPLRIVARYESVEIFRHERAPVVLSGLSARIISELVAFDGPVSWGLLARELWPSAGESTLRHRWDVCFGRLRSRLKQSGLRSDLVRSDGSGQVNLLLYEGDSVVDLL
tara:strand:+ start:61585 stop:62481 length:897 start_codon:yes stop_codon:yes gene_type:complete